MRLSRTGRQNRLRQRCLVRMIFPAATRRFDQRYPGHQACAFECDHPLFARQGDALPLEARGRPVGRSRRLPLSTFTRTIWQTIDSNQTFCFSKSGHYAKKTVLLA